MQYYKIDIDIYELINNTEISNINRLKVFDFITPYTKTLNSFVYKNFNIDQFMAPIYTKYIVRS